MNRDDAIQERDDYPLAPATFKSCHAKPVQANDGGADFICDICGDVTDKPGCPLWREVPR